MRRTVSVPRSEALKIREGVSAAEKAMETLSHLISWRGKAQRQVKSVLRVVQREDPDIVDPQPGNEVEADFADQTAVIPPAAGPTVRQAAVEEPVVNHHGKVQPGPGM